MSVQLASPPDGERNPADSILTSVACDLDKTPNSNVRDLVRGLLTGCTGS